MSYTTLRVSRSGVVLFAAHAERLGPALLPAFESFAASATEGVYSLRAQGYQLLVEQRPESRLRDGVALRTAVSPVLARGGPFPKPASPSEYDAVRAPGTVTLLTDAAGEELYECDLASVMAWDGSTLILVPEDRPRVLSVAELFVARTFAHRRAPIRVDGTWGLLLINAVAAVSPITARAAFSPMLLQQIRSAIEATARRSHFLND